MPKKRIGSVTHKGGDTYLLRLSCGTDDYGRRIQPSRTVHCSNEREAEKLLFVFYNEREAVLNDRILKNPQTLEELYNEWMKQHVIPKLSVKSKDNYEQIWKHLQPYKKIKLSVIKARHIHDILKGIPYSRQQQALFDMLRAMFNKAVKWEYMTDNPCNHSERPAYKSPEKPIIPKDELNEVLQIVSCEPLKYQVAFYFAITCTLRRQEVAGLKWSNIDFDKNIISIKKGTTIVKGKGTQEKETKTEKSRRKLYLPGQLKNVLIEWRAEQGQHRLKMGNKWENNDYIFTTDTGRIINLHTITNWWSDLMKANPHLTYVTFHGLRHTAASYMLHDGADIRQVSATLGHANTSTTLNTYAHVIDDTKEEVISLMENRLSMNIKRKAKGAV